MRAVHVLVVTAATALLLASSARAQDSSHVLTSPPVTRDEVGTLRLAIGGVSGGFAGAGLGLGTGLLVGRASCRSGPNSRDFCGLADGLAGGLAGLTVGTPIGVHLANHRLGNGIFTVIGSITATAALLALSSTLTQGNGPPFVLMLPFEIGTAIPIERHTERP